MSPSPITCFGLGSAVPRVYWLYPHPEGLLVESGIGADGNWYTAGVLGPLPVLNFLGGVSLACFGVRAEASRIYYLNGVDRGVIEVGWGSDSRWYWAAVYQAVKSGGAPTAALGSSIACFGVNGQASRVYYFDDSGRVIELGWGADNQWYAGSISGPGLDSGRGIACFGVGGQASRVYCCDLQGQVMELGWGADGKWYSANIGQSAGAPAALSGSRIACFGVHGQASRVYYFGVDGRVVELAFGSDGNWHWSPVGQRARQTGPSKCLTCLGLGGSVPRVYYFDPTGFVIELARGFDAEWHSTSINNDSSVLASPDSDITCFGVGGDAAPRVYYYAADGRAVELSSDGFSSSWASFKLPPMQSQ